MMFIVNYIYQKGFLKNFKKIVPGQSFYTPLLNPKEVYKNLPSKRPMGYDKGVLCEFQTGFT
jgi:hypothetical protein